MKNRQVHWIADSLSPLALVLLGLSVFSGCAAGSGSFEESSSFSGIDAVEIDGSFFNVEVESHSLSSVDAEVNIPDRLKRRGVTVEREQSGSTLRMNVKGRWRGGGFLSAEVASIKIKAPADTELDIKTSSGNISVGDLETREIKVSASSGKISISECGGALIAGSSSGRIDIESCTGLKSVDSSSGNIVIRNSEGDIEANSSSGKHTYENIAGSIRGKSTSGRIEVSGTEGMLILESNSGNLSGSGITITGDSSFETTSGSIDMDFSNDLDDFTMDLKSSSGRINAGKTSAEGTVVTGSGAIRIRGKSSSGKQTYK